MGEEHVGLIRSMDRQPTRLQAPLATHDADGPEEAVVADDVHLGRLMVHPSVPRAEVVRMCAGTAPAMLARAVEQLRPAELSMVMTKLHERPMPPGQSPVVNRIDDPLLRAAEASPDGGYDDAATRLLSMLGARGCGEPPRTTTVDEHHPLSLVTDPESRSRP